MNYTIIGAGPTGLTAGYLLLQKNQKVTILERDSQVGGISKTVRYKKYRFDIGGHRFFAKIPEITEFWHEMLGRQFLSVKRSSRIFYNRKFYNYPLEPKNALFNLGPFQATLAIASYVKSKFGKRPEDSLADVYINSFGSVLYKKFFENYSTKLWGMSPAKMEPDWGTQRVGKLSLTVAIKDAFFPKSDDEVKTLTKRFKYPKYGPGMMWETVARKIKRKGGKVLLDSPVEKIIHKDKRVIEIYCSSSTQAGTRTSHFASLPKGKPPARRIKVDNLLSTMALRDLILSLSPEPPEKVLKAARGIKYRDFILVAVVVKCKETFPDQWIYIQDPGYRATRIQNVKNWSRFMVPDNKKSVLNMEYVTNEDEDLWQMTDSELAALAKKEIVGLGFAKEKELGEAMVVRQLKAYPVYDLGYKAKLEIIKNYLSQFENLVTIGRNGMHKYNNMDHSMLTAIQAVENIFGSKHDIWQVNVNADYHETVKKK